MNARPSLSVTYASALMTTGQTTAVEEKLQAAENAIPRTEQDDRLQDLVGRIASMRATLAVMQHDVETIIAQSRRALEYLHEGNLPLRTATTWTLGYAYQLQGDRARASRAYAEVIAISTSFGDSIYTIAATINLVNYRKQTTSSIQQPRPTGESCTWLVIRRSGLHAKGILAWPAYTTNGTTWMLPNSTGNNASN